MNIGVRQKKYKFRVRIDSFDNQTEVGQGSERIVRTHLLWR